MELKYLNTVRMILETGSFQEAARRLHYTQSTVTFQVQQLEKELNVKLFEKLGRRGTFCPIWTACLTPPRRSWITESVRRS